MAVVLDESHKIKNPDSKTAKAIFAIKDYAKKRLILTGTPVANRPVDLWAQFYFLDNGRLLGDNFAEFQKKYSVDFKEQRLAEEKNKFDDLRNLISSNSIRRLKKDVLELPEKVFIEKKVSLTIQQRNMYDKLRDELYLEITNIDGTKKIDESSLIVKKILRLVQIASNPFLIDKSYNETPAKFKLMDNLVEEIVAKDEKVIIWSSFVENIRLLYRRYKLHGALMISGEIPIEKRNEIVKQFRDNEDFKVLVANPAAAREGLTLTSANNAVYLDRNFNLVDYLQSQDRIHRISQTKKCFIYKLIGEKTIDEYVEEIIFKKQNLAEYIQGDKKDIEIQHFLTKEELLTILGGTRHG
jgi:SNF2 family DNA or RNA helicase